MRVRRFSAIFWATCLVSCCLLLYIMTDLSLNSPNTKPALQDVDENKWASFQSKLQTLEEKLKHHHNVVKQIKTVVNKISQTQEHYDKDEASPNRDNIKSLSRKDVVFQHVEDEAIKLHTMPVVPPLNMSTCAIQKNSVPKTDIQMLSMYERIDFDDKDGGVWKQGWKVEYDDKQWNSKNKLKVFIVPHSHNDPGWLKTIENYYKSQTRSIFKNMIEKLPESPFRKFIWAEVSYLSLWWNSDASPEDKKALKDLLKAGQLEIVTGGWVMNDEANSHWLSVTQQLTTGHQWLVDNLNYRPKNGWSIDPFGHSSSQPYLLKLAGIKNSVIQRVHYRIKKELALNRQLEFKWRQLWDGKGKTDMMTHMMPFYSYDVPHSCGPDPKVCCQFDFKRLPGNGVTCPWGIPPRKIIQKNVEERASLILDQWRKKAQLYRSNVVLFPLGDDFRYDRANEWDNQSQNYEMLINFINGKEDWNAEVQFGTLADYFKAVHAEVQSSEFPVLSGDFFTYADRVQHYWSGYYTSRPFFKAMDRVLLSYVRAAETISAQASMSGSVSYILSLQLRDRVEQARRALSLFQHHDGVTGTARDDVMLDYADKMLTAIKYCQSAIQQAAYYLLKRPPIQDQTQDDIFFEVDDIWRKNDEIPTKITIALDVLMPSRKIVVYNSLGFKRIEILTVLVSSPHVEVFDPQGNPIMSQISPVVSGEKRLSFANNKYQLSFIVTVGPLSLVTYTVSLRDVASINKYTSFAKVRVYNADYWNVDLPKMFVIEQPGGRLADDVTLQAGASTRVVTNMNGMIKAIVARDGTVTPVHMDFVHYGSQRARDNNSGAYLFIPDGPARLLRPEPFPELVVVEGMHRATLYSALIGPKAAEIVLTISVSNNPSSSHSEVEISNTFLLDSQVDDLELAIRFSTSIDNGDVFYTDVNGMQMIKRRYFEKLPLQANFYPLPAATYIEDEHTRLTLLTSTPLGMAALRPGQIEIMQDRRLSRDDNRGLEQPIVDNVRTRHVLRLLLEGALPCIQKQPLEQPSGQLTVGAHVSQQTLLHPLVSMQYNAREDAGYTEYSEVMSLGADVVIASFNAHVTGQKIDETLHGTGLTFQRVHLDTCYGTKDATTHYPLGHGWVSIPDLTGASSEDIYDSSLTYTHIGTRAPNGGILTICPMEIKSVFVHNGRQKE